jgi:hypothetical protein
VRNWYSVRIVAICVVLSVFVGTSELRADDNPVAPVQDSNVVKPQPECTTFAPVPVAVSSPFYEMMGPILRTGGGVVLQKGNERFRASQVEYNTDTEIGVAHNVFFTTCTAERPDWHITASRVVLLPSHKLQARSVALYVGRTRVLVLPSMKLTVGGRSATSAVFPRPGYDHRDGVTLAQTLRVTDTTHSRTTLDLKFTTLHSIEAVLSSTYGCAGRLTAFPGRHLTYGSMRSRALNVPQPIVGNCDPQLLRPTGAAHLQPFGTITLRQRTYDARNLGLVVFRQPELGLAYVGGQLSTTKRRLDPRIELYPQITASWGRFKEIPGASDFETRSQLAVQGAINAVWLGTNTTVQPVGIATYATYSNGQVFRTVGFGLDAAHLARDGSYYSARYISRTSSGSTPFLFDNIDIAKEADLAAQRYFGKGVAGIALCYDADNGSLFDWEVMLGHRTDCLGTYVRWDNRFQRFGFDVALINL